VIGINAGTSQLTIEYLEDGAVEGPLSFDPSELM
jgi:hypothetical protein